MLSWSNNAYKFTLGIGSLAVAGMLAELTKAKLPVWLALTIALLPLGFFVFIRPEELPLRVVRIAHVLASAWYLLTAVGLFVVLARTELLPRGWPVCVLAVVAGSLPCLIVLFKALIGTYGPPDIEEDSRA